MIYTNANSVKNVVFSLILGLIFGFLYDIIRTVDILMGVLSFSDGKSGYKSGFWPAFLLFFTDTLYILSVTVVFSVFLYAVNNGDFRLYIALACACGCAAYHATVGRLVVPLTGSMAKGVRIAVQWAVIRPVAAVARFLWRITIGRASELIRWRVAVRRDRRVREKIKKEIRFGET